MPAGPSLRRGTPLALGTLLGLFAAQLVGAQLPSAPLLCAAGAACLAFDLGLRLWKPGVLAVLGRVHCDETVRQLLRDLLLVMGLTHLSAVDTAARLVLVGGLLSCYGAQFVCRALGVLVRRARTLPVVTRNVDTDALRLSPAPPRLLAYPGRRMLLFSVPATSGMIATIAAQHVVWGLIGVGTSLLLFAGGTAYLATWLLPGKRPPGEEKVLRWFRDWLADYRPEVGLYFSGGSGTAYQANMWLSTLATLPRPLVVLRERPMTQQLADTDVPIVCIPRVAHLMELEHSSLKMLLHPANAPKTSQVLRIPTIKHAFTNHGESDKLSSCNPYAKVYDQVWVAGPAARLRYARADVGVDDRDVVEVGRPQLAPIRRADGPPPATRPVTVLYAPTWEGWTNDPGNTSVILAGENVVRALLADPRVRLLYRPHPMTGSVNPKAGAADARVRALIAEANAGRTAAPAAARPAPGPRRAPLRLPTGDPVAERGAVSVAGPGSADGPRPDSPAAELERQDAALAALTARAGRLAADEMERMAAQGLPRPGHAEAVAAATDAWRAAFWAAQDPAEHLVLTGSRPDLYSCFNEADVLVSDVSSVVADHLASGKPYAVVNTTGLSEDDFRAANATVRGATVLTPEADGVPALLDAVVDPGQDKLAEARTELTAYLLGPAQPPSLTRFQDAVRALCAAAEARRARHGTLPGAAQAHAAEVAELAETAESEAGGDQAVAADSSELPIAPPAAPQGATR
ncbi:hypothetical protein [Streptomyces avicenniae]|uniref:hypothetical protein n=1 Tax=Streptomyces avicenniae TaxID=500153 RepID=UPI00069B8EB6|nr:hypothetical protein [Streptomyces avicenniae]